jgi:hypothetical protein
MQVFKVRDTQDQSGEPFHRPPIIYNWEKDRLGNTIEGFIWRNKSKRIFPIWESEPAEDYITFMSGKLSEMTPVDRKAVQAMLLLPISDFASIFSVGLYVMNQRFLDVMGSFLLASGEIRQVVNYPDLYLFNLFFPTPCFDEIHSLYGLRGSTPDVFGFLEFPEDHPDLFVLSQSHHLALCTTRFKTAYEKNNFQGLQFQLVFDFENPDFIDERYPSDLRHWLDNKAKLQKKLENRRKIYGE